MSLQERISAQSKLESDLLLQNDRIGRLAFKRENKVLPFKQVDQDLLREYNAQFPSQFEYTDEYGEKRYSKYQIPENKPELEEPDLIENNVNIDVVLRDEQLVTKRVEEVKNALINNNNNIESVKKEINEGKIKKRQGKAILNDLNQEFIDLKRELEDLENLIPEINQYKNQYEEINKENEARKMITSQKNKGKLKVYSEELKILNKGAFNTEQLPNETETEYYDRLRKNAELAEPEDKLFNAQMLTLQRFKDKLKEIIRDPTKIEQISNSFDVDSKLSILKIFPLIKSRLTKIYGLNNPSVTSSDIIEFMKSFLFNKDEHLKDEEEDEEFGISYKETPIQATPLSRNAKVELTMTEIAKKYYRNPRKLRQKLDDIKRNSESPYYEYFKDVTTTSSTGKLKTNQQLLESIARRIVDIDESPEKIGFGIKSEKLPETVQFGKLLILLHKLYYKNILSVKHHNKISIAGLKNTKVSDKFVKIILSMIEGIHPTVSDINSLSITEKQLYDRLIYLAGLNKTVPHTQDKTINDLKKRMKLVEGEIEIGNNSPLLHQELYQIVHSLKDFGVLSQKDIKHYLEQFK